MKFHWLKQGPQLRLQNYNTQSKLLALDMLLNNMEGFVVLPKVLQAMKQSKNL